MRMHQAVWTDDGGQRTADLGIRNDFVPIGHRWQKIVARVEIRLATDQRIEAFPDAASNASGSSVRRQR